MKDNFMARLISYAPLLMGLTFALSGCSESGNNQMSSEQEKMAPVAQEKTINPSVAQPEETMESSKKVDPLPVAADKWTEQTKELGASAWESTKEVAGDAADSSKEYLEVAKEKTADAYEATKEKSAELIEATKEKAVDAYEAAKKGTQEAIENSKNTSLETEELKKAF